MASSYDFMLWSKFQLILFSLEIRVSMVIGSCVCGEIEYQVELIPGKVYNCHCLQCRKSHGSAFATQAFAKGETLKFTRGEELLGEYRGRLGIRAFCTKCGSRLMNYAPNKSEYLSIALSTVDSGEVGKPVANAFVDYKASWYNLSDEIPCYSEIPDGALD